LGYQDEEAIKRFLVAVVDEFLTRHEFANPVKAREARFLPVSTPASMLGSGRKGGMMLPPTSPASGRSVLKMKGSTSSRLGFGQSVDQGYRSGGKAENAELGSSKKAPVVEIPRTPNIEIPRLPPITQTPTMNASDVESTSKGKGKRLLDWQNGEYEVDASGRKRYKWIDDILAVSKSPSATLDNKLISQEVDSGILPFTPKPLDGTSCSDWHSVCHYPPSSISAKPYLTSTTIRSTTDITFTASALLHATILGQVDHKFICAAIPSKLKHDTVGPTLVMIDQHAADERVSIEAILKELCEGFLADSIPITELSEPLPAIIISRQEAGLLCEAGKNESLARWGIELDVSAFRGSEGGDDGDYVQIPIRAVPIALKDRLGRKEASEMTRLIKLYLPVLGVGMRQIDALINRSEGGDMVDWGEVLRWMPKEMLELAVSKACRSKSDIISSMGLRLMM
jgi:DNA mismatch repair protein MLH3